MRFGYKINHFPRFYKTTDQAVLVLFRELKQKVPMDKTIMALSRGSLNKLDYPASVSKYD